MDLVVFVVAISLIASLWMRVGFKPTDDTVRGLGRAFGFWRADGWPRGVQEEDPQRRWGAGRPNPPPAQRSITIPEPEPPVVVVRPVVPRP